MTTTNVLVLSLEPAHEGGPSLAIRIDGRDQMDLAREVERAVT